MSGLDADVIIAGGGLVGASLATALAGQGLRVTVIEAVPYGGDDHPGFDDRVIALAYGSMRILDGLGLWRELAPGATPIRRIHISDRGHFGATRLTAREEGVPALGYVVAARAMGRALERALGAGGVRVVAPALVVAVTPEDDAVEVTVESGGEELRLRAALLVAADGGESTVRAALGIGARTRDYGQSAVIANVLPDRPHQQTAFERFTDTGPLALLPMPDNRYAMVWTVAHRQVEDLLALCDTDFLAALQERFGARAGRFVRTGSRAVYPLRLIRARAQVAARAVVIGNAAHTLHPVAGQGFNLGLRDAAALAETVVDARRRGVDPGSPQVLRSYARWRGADQNRAALFTDGLVRLFSHPFPPLALARNLGLVTLDLLPALKHGLARTTMGLVGRQSRLARGRSL
ncbi:MAG: 2-octaprenyl-6-methoxyphenyl hydroxylase [Gammaproteobacteria bacterium]|nr:2-octaprenyl-6-methoxyphenyl hydroxylase [Gammaproteobacteria bacterium]